MERQPIEPGPGDALLVADVQNDFLPGGALAAARAGEVLRPLTEWVNRFWERGRPIFAGRDWHPPDHCSFAAQGGPWPTHCVAGTPGARFAVPLHLEGRAAVVSKGYDRAREAYSAFDGTPLERELRALEVRRLFIGGLTTEYCVRQTALDALKRGFDVVILEDAVRPIDETAQPRVLAELRAAGAVLLSEVSA